MITTVLRHSGADPGYVIGGILAETGLGAGDGSGAEFVAEADESDGSFLMLAPELAIVTSVEADHLDNYAGLAEIEAAFAAFARRITPGGVLIACADDPGARALAAAAAAAGVRVRCYGQSPGADYRLSGVSPRGIDRALLSVSGPAAGPGAPCTGPARGRRPRPSQRAERNGRLRRRPRAWAEPRAGHRGTGRLPRRGPPDGTEEGRGRLSVLVLDRLSCAPPDRTRCRSPHGPRDQARWARSGGLPAAPVQPDQDFRGRVRHRARPG